MRTIRREMKDERTQRMEAEVRMIRSLEETVELSAQRLISLKTQDIKSVITYLVSAIFSSWKAANMQSYLSTVDWALSTVRGGCVAVSAAFQLLFRKPVCS